MKRPRSGKNGRKNTTTHLRSSTKNTIPTSPISISAFTVTTAKLWEQLRSKAARGKREPSIKCFRHPCFPFPNPLWKHTHIFHSSPSGLPEKTEDTPPQVEKPGDEAQAATTAQEKIGNTQQQREAMLKNQEARAKALREGEKGPETKDETHLDRLMGNFDSAVKEHDDAEAKAAEVRQKLKNDPENPELQKELKQHEMEKIKAVMKAFATFFEGLKRLFNGTLFESSKGDGKGSESGTQKPAEGVANKPAAATTPEQQVKKELAKNNPKSAAEAQAALGEIRENADNKIKENTKSIESLDKRIDGIKKENDVLIGKKGEVEKELNKLQGEEGKEDQILELKTELDRLNTIIEANQKAIKTLDDRRDALTKENKDLTAKRDAAEKMGEDMEKGMEKLLPMIQKLAEMLGLKLQDLNIGYNGQPIIVINNFNGNNIPVATALEAMGAKQNPETQTVEISAEQAPQASEKVSERLELWRQDIQDRMDRHGYDVVVALNEDKTSFVLRTSADTKDAMKDLKTVEGFAQKRGMQPANMQDGGLALNIDRYIQKEGYFGPAFSEESLKIEQVQDDNFAAQSSEGGTNGLGPGYPEELLEGTYEQGKAAPQVASVEQPTRNSDLGPGYPEEVLEGTYGQAQKNVEVAQEDNLGPGYDASMLEGTDGRKIS